MARSDDLCAIIEASPHIPSDFSAVQLNGSATALAKVTTSSWTAKGMRGIKLLLGPRKEPEPSSILGIGGQSIIVACEMSLKARHPWREWWESISEYTGKELHEVDFDYEFFGEKSKDSELKNAVCNELMKKVHFDEARQKFQCALRIGITETLRRESATSRIPRRDIRQKGLLLDMHPNLVTLISYAPVEQRPVFLMQKVNRIEWESLPLRERFMALREGLEGVRELHRLHVWHRDLKPANILLERENGKVKTYVGDFGLIKPANPEKWGMSMTSEGTVVGTYAYMSPEQARGSEATAQSDIFSVAALAYTLLTGELPLQTGRNGSDEVRRAANRQNYGGIDPMLLVKYSDKSFVRRIRDLAAAGMQYHPGDRHQTIGQFIGDLDAILSNKDPSHTYTLPGTPESRARGVYMKKKVEEEGPIEIRVQDNVPTPAPEKKKKKKKGIIYRGIRAVVIGAGLAGLGIAAIDQDAFGMSQYEVVRPKQEKVRYAVDIAGDYVNEGAKKAKKAIDDAMR